MGLMMSYWLFNLPVAWMAVVVFVGAYLVAAIVHWIVTKLAVGERARAFKALSPGMLPPLGIIFGLLVGFIAAQVWSDFERAKVAVATEASALRTVNLLAASLPAEQQGRLRSLIAQHVDEGGKSRMAGNGATACDYIGATCGANRGIAKHAGHNAR